MVKFSRLIL